MDLRGKIVQYSYCMPQLQQVAREMSANESSSAGNEDVRQMSLAPVFAGIDPDRGRVYASFFLMNATMSPTLSIDSSSAVENLTPNDA